MRISVGVDVNVCHLFEQLVEANAQMDPVG
jgi:hypothetical protein